MKIKKGTPLIIVHSRRGVLKCFAAEYFNTEIKEYWPVIAAETTTAKTGITKGGEVLTLGAHLVISIKRGQAL